MVYWKATDPLLRGLGLGGVVSMVSMIVSAFFYNFWFMVEINGQQWILMGMITQIRRIVTQTESAQIAAAQAVAPAVTASEASAPAAAEPVPLYRLIS